MSQTLSNILELVRKEYIKRMDANHFAQPFLTAEKLCHEKLYLDTDLLARIVSEDPTLLATRASDLIADPKERDNPAVGAIISSNIVMAALESLLALAVGNKWLDVDNEGHILVEEAELKAIDKEIRAIVQDSAQFAQDSPEPAEAELWTDICA